MAEYEEIASPNFNERKGEGVSLIVLHYTGMETARQAIERLTDPQSEVSAHYTVDEDGSIYRHVDEAMRAWHAGHSCWQGESDINSVSIGVELVNPGHEWGYRPFTGAQMKALTALCKDVMARHGIEPENIVGHSDVAPARKSDPGEYFPWRDLASQGVGVWPDISDEDAVKAAGINIERALHDYGYDPRVKLREKITAFQRHFVPEAFVNGHAGEADNLTRVRLYALLAGHLLEENGAW
ncbi:MAG: N-acetylmuramoyl-L-alanine amidase [Micavibrio sp.]